MGNDWLAPAQIVDEHEIKPQELNQDNNNIASANITTNNLGKDKISNSNDLDVIDNIIKNDEENDNDDVDVSYYDDDDDNNDFDDDDDDNNNNDNSASQQQQQQQEQELNEYDINEEKMWISAIAQEPKSSHLRNQLANHYFSQHRLNEAEFAYKAAIKLDINNSIAHYDYAFMRHHQFYWALSKLNIHDAKKYADESKFHYHSVLKLEENDIETHYQLSLLYLTMLETTLIESIDNIQSTLNIVSILYLAEDICCGNITTTHNDNNNNKYAEYPIGRGKYSPWFDDRCEIYFLCLRHIRITMDLCNNELDPVLFGTYITYSRLLYIECIPPLVYGITSNNSDSDVIINNKLKLGIKYLNNAMDINANDATLHHDLGLLLSHKSIGKYNDAIYHWQIAIKLDSTNYLYYIQIGYIYQYYLYNISLSIKYYNKALLLKNNNSNLWNNIGIISAQNAKIQKSIIYSNKCWRKCLKISANNCEAYRNLGNIQWLHYYNTHKGEIYLQKAISISYQVYNKINDDINKLKLKLKNQSKSGFRTGSGTRKNQGSGTGSKLIFSEDNTYDDNVLINIKYNILYYELLRDKFSKFLSQSKSDYGGLLLMMFKYDIEAEKELRDSLFYDNNCISAHYYLGKHLFNIDLKQSLFHLNKYIKLEIVNKNLSNKSHANQLIAEIYLKSKQYKTSLKYFNQAIKISSAISGPGSSLPIWALCKIYCGAANSILKYELNKLYNDYGGISIKKQNIINKLRSKSWNNPDNSKSQINDIVFKLATNLEIAKKYYRKILKLDNKYVCAPLGLAEIFNKFEGKILLSDKHYTDSINICQNKLIILYNDYLNQLKIQKKDQINIQIHKQKLLKYNDLVLSNLNQTRIAMGFKKQIKNQNDVNDDDNTIDNDDDTDKISDRIDDDVDDNKSDNNDNKSKKKLKFSSKFGINLRDIDVILDNNNNILIKRIIFDIREYIEYCIEGHLGKTDLIIQSCHNNKWKEALSNCNKIIYLDPDNISGYIKKSLLHWKLKQKNKAIKCALHVLNLAKIYDKNKKNMKNKNSKKIITKENIVQNNLFMIFKYIQINKTKSNDDNDD